MPSTKDASGLPAKAQPSDYVDELNISPERRAELIDESRKGIVTRMGQMIAGALAAMTDELAELAAYNLVRMRNLGVVSC